MKLFTRDWTLWDMLSAILCAGLAIVVLIQVLTRFVLRIPMPWTEEVSRICFIYVVFLGAALGMRDRKHVNVDFLLTKASGKARAIWDSAIDIAVAVLLIAWLWLGIRFVLMSTDQVTPYLRMPISVMYLAIPLSAAIMLYYLIAGLVRRFRTPESKGRE